MSVSDLIARYPDLMARCLNLSGTTILITIDEEYKITFCTDSLVQQLHLLHKPTGTHLGSVLCPLEEAEFFLTISNSSKKFLPQLFRLCESNDLYRCYTFPIDTGYLVWGHKMGSTENEILESMSHLNNELSDMSRQLSKANRELNKKNQELEWANEKITRISRTDYLTGLSNRSYFQERLKEIFALTKRHGLEFTILLADLDHFKRINDTYGHDMGDKVLQAFGTLLANECRTEDLPARYGGEEFILVFPKTHASGVITFYERIRRELIHSDLLPDSDFVTFSAGITEYEEGGTEISLLKKADDALYEAKKNGRDRYVISP